jgi:hypothetical protein
MTCFIQLASERTNAASLVAGGIEMRRTFLVEVDGGKHECSEHIVLIYDKLGRLIAVGVINGNTGTYPWHHIVARWTLDGEISS